MVENPLQRSAEGAMGRTVGHESAMGPTGFDWSAAQVSRSLQACQGAVLLCDAVQGTKTQAWRPARFH